jgi:succinate dehydrogenase / fumarate reductase, cytochrome b subunit
MPSDAGFANSRCSRPWRFREHELAASPPLPPPGPGSATLGSPAVALPLWARVHALTGAIPLAGYLLLHLLTQSSVLGSGAAYVAWTRRIDAVPWMRGIEFLVIDVPLGIHVLTGLCHLFSGQGLFSGRSLSGQGLLSGQAVVTRNGWVGRRGRALQQGSGLVLLGFLGFHVWQFRGRSWLGELDRSDFLPELCASLSSTAWGGIPVVALVYLLGVAAAALHAGQGLYHACRAWGVGAAGHERALARACALGALSFFVLGALTVVELATGSLRLHFPG